MDAVKKEELFGCILQGKANAVSLERATREITCCAGPENGVLKYFDRCDSLLQKNIEL
jgi:hypothetical protein